MEVQCHHDPYSKFQASQGHRDCLSQSINQSVSQSVTKTMTSVAAKTTTTSTKKTIPSLKKLLYKNSSTVLVQFNTIAGNNFAKFMFFKVDGTGKGYSFFFPAVYLCQPGIVKLYILLICYPQLSFS